MVCHSPLSHKYVWLTQAHMTQRTYSLTLGCSGSSMMHSSKPLETIPRIRAAGVFSSGKSLRDSNELHHLYHYRLPASLKLVPLSAPTGSPNLSIPTSM